MPLQAPIMLALCSMLSHAYYAQFYAGIIAACLPISVVGPRLMETAVQAL